MMSVVQQTIRNFLQVFDWLLCINEKKYNRCFWGSFKNLLPHTVLIQFMTLSVCTPLEPCIYLVSWVEHFYISPKKCVKNYLILGSKVTLSPACTDAGLKWGHWCQTAALASGDCGFTLCSDRKRRRLQALFIITGPNHGLYWTEAAKPPFSFFHWTWICVLLKL